MDKNQTKISGRGRENSETKFHGQGFAFFSKFSHTFFSNLKKNKCGQKSKITCARRRENSKGPRRAENTFLCLKTTYLSTFFPKICFYSSIIC